MTDASIRSDSLQAYGFRSISLSSPDCFSPFPHGTRSLSISKSIQPQELVLPDSLGLFVSRTTQEQEQRRLQCFRIQDYYLLGSSFPACCANTKFCNFSHRKDDALALQPQAGASTRLVWAVPVSLAATQGIASLLIIRCENNFHKNRIKSKEVCFLFLQVLRCFTSLGTLPAIGGVIDKIDWVSPFGDLRVKGCQAPRRSLSQPRHVLHRLLESRHSPYALRLPIRKSKNRLYPIIHAKNDRVYCLQYFLIIQNFHFVKILDKFTCVFHNFEIQNCERHF